MNIFKSILLILFLIIVSPVFSQDSDEKNTQLNLLLIPILETIFSNDIYWNPEWPSAVPPDSFLIKNTSLQPAVIELYNGTLKFSVRRDAKGRLTEFPFFLSDGYAEIRAVYNENTLQSVNIAKYSFASDEETSEETAPSLEMTLNVYFPPDFLPYSELSLGGGFPPLSVMVDGTAYFVFIFESPLFLSETWFDTDGNMVLFSKAQTIVDRGEWRIRTLQIHNDNGIYFIDYCHDSYGNVTEIRSGDRVISAFYRGNIPRYRTGNDLRYEYHWDTQGILTTVKGLGENDFLFAEYRYGYDQDTAGNWISRRETAYIYQYELMAPNFSYSRGIWNRRIVY
jgi:hypothetical protein